ncbi:MAG: ComEC/Rec2-related protein [Alteromonas naphthalenivorans]|jgi:ComEC/Rec2-related protein
MIHIEKFLHKIPFLSLKLPLSFWGALGFISGIFLAHHSLLLIAPTLIVAMCLKKDVCLNTKIMFLFTFLGLATYMYSSSYTRLPVPTLKNVIVEGVITDKAFIDHSFWKHRVRLNVSKIKTDQGLLPYPFVVYIYSRNRIYGWVQDTIQCGPLTIKEPAEGGFALYLKREGVAGTSFSDKILYTKVHRPTRSFLNWIFWQRELLQIKLRKKFSRQTFSLFSSLFIGNRNPVTNTLAPHKQHFKKWGILHHLARSGLHLIVFIMIWHFLLNSLPLSFACKHFIISFFLLTYFLFSWSSLSFLRAFIVYALYKAGTFAQSKVHPLHAICSVCLLLLLHNPFHVFFLDFQLSFLLSFCLLWITHIDHQRNIFHYKSLAEKNKKNLS